MKEPKWTSMTRMDKQEPNWESKVESTFEWMPGYLPTSGCLGIRFPADAWVSTRMSIIRPCKQNMVANFFSYFNDLKKIFHWYRSTGKSSKNIPVLCIAMRAFYGFILALPIR